MLKQPGDVQLLLVLYSKQGNTENRGSKARSWKLESFLQAVSQDHPETAISLNEGGQRRSLDWWQISAWTTNIVGA